MVPTNDFLPFCPTDTGTNLLSQSDYIAATDRTDGNQPGVASSKLNNKALRQGTYVAGQLAQFLSNQLAADVLDDDIPNKLLSQFLATLKPYVPNQTKYTSGSNTWNMNYVFFIVSGNATAAATYTNNAVTFTVVSTVSGATEVRMTGNADPTVSGTLTKTGGTGDATLTFYARRKPLYLEVELVAGGGGGGGLGSGSSNGGVGGDSTFGTSLLSAKGGNLGTAAGTAGIATSGSSLGTGPVGFIVEGAGGGNATGSGSNTSGGNGGSSAFGGAGQGGIPGTIDATAATTNSGSGGGGGENAGASGGGGGGSGAYIRAKIFTPLSTYAAVVGAAGAAGAGTRPGGAGALGLILVTEHYQ